MLGLKGPKSEVVGHGEERFLRAEDMSAVPKDQDFMSEFVEAIFQQIEGQVHHPAPSVARELVAAVVMARSTKALLPCLGQLLRQQSPPLVCPQICKKAHEVCLLQESCAVRLAEAGRSSCPQEDTGHREEALQQDTLQYGPLATTPATSKSSVRMK